MKKRIIFIEGLPNVGKTTLVAALKNRGFASVPELPESIATLGAATRNDDQKVYMQNDMEKFRLAKAEHGMTLVDRGPLSTLAYNMARHALDKNYDVTPVVDWFGSRVQQQIYGRSDVLTVYLKGKTLPSYNSSTDPYGSTANLAALENVTLQLLKLLPIEAIVIDYDYQNGESIDNIYALFDSFMRS